MEEEHMLENIKLKPEGIRKINKKMVVSLLCAFLFFSVVLFGIGIEPKKNGSAQSTPTPNAQEPVAMTQEKVHLESFEALPRTYAEQMSGSRLNNNAQNGQPSTYMDPGMYDPNNNRQGMPQSYPYGYNPGDPRLNRSAPYDPYSMDRQGSPYDQKKQVVDEARKSKILFSEASTSAKKSQPATPDVMYQVTSMPTMPQGMMMAPPLCQADTLSDQARKRAFLDESKKKDDAVYLEQEIQEPRSPYQVMAGTVLPAVMVTGINSDLPGQIIAQIRENVYDSVSGKYLLIPQGTKLIGTYDNQISWGQDRVMQVWTRMMFPNGSSILLNGMQGTDLAGYAGAADKVNNHYGRIAGAVLLSTFLSVGARQAGGTDSEGAYPTVGQQMAGEAAGGFNQAGQKLLNRELNVAPTIEIRPGYKFNIMVNRDMILKPYSLQ
jgi:type IV secretion system protein TrbI